MVDNLKIISLTTENIKKIKAVFINPDGAVVQITGANGAGKTSVLDAIWYALANAKVLPEVPIRTDAEPGKDGAQVAFIKLDLGQFKITRTFRKKKDVPYTTKLIVENPDGARFQNPTSMVETLIGALSFNPLDFLDLPKDKQFLALRAFVPDVDFDAIEVARKKDYDERTAVNRLAEQARTLAKAIVIPGEAPQMVDDSAIVDEIEAAGKHNAGIATEQAQRTAKQAELTASRGTIAATDDVLAEVDKQIRVAEERLNDLKAQREQAVKNAADNIRRLEDAEAAFAALPPLAEPIDVIPIRLKLNESRTTNDRARKVIADKERQAQYTKEAEHYEAQSTALTKAIDDRKATVAKAVAEAKLPVPGLGFGDGEVLLNELPFAQASDAQQLRAAVAVAAALNPRLRVIRIRDGNRLDSSGMAELEKFAIEHDVQVWIERVDESGQVGFYIEDGHVAAVDGKPVGEAAE